MKAFLALMIVAGFLVLIYPSVSNRWNEYRMERLTGEYDTSVQAIDDTEKTALFEAAAKYNRTLVGSAVLDVFATRDEVRDPLYESLLNPAGSGMMGQVEVPVIGVKLPVYHYTTEDVLEQGAGHLPGSSLPVGGKGTHVVISAHRGLPRAKLFTDLDRLKKGDMFYLYILGKTFAYEVDRTKVVEPQNTKDLAIEEGKEYCTLLTCTPYGVNTQRLLVRGHRVPYSDARYLAESGSKSGPGAESVLMRLLCVLIGIIAAFSVVWLWRKKFQRK